MQQCECCGQHTLKVWTEYESYGSTSVPVQHAECSNELCEDMEAALFDEDEELYNELEASL